MNFFQRLFMSIACLVVAFSAFTSTHRAFLNESNGHSKKELSFEKVTSLSSEINSPASLVDIEENTIEFDEKEESEDNDSDSFFHSSTQSGALLFVSLNKEDYSSKNPLSKRQLPLFILFENFRL